MGDVGKGDKVKGLHVEAMAIEATEGLGKDIER